VLYALLYHLNALHVCCVHCFCILEINFIWFDLITPDNADSAYQGIAVKISRLSITRCQIRLQQWAASSSRSSVWRGLGLELRLVECECVIRCYLWWWSCKSSNCLSSRRPFTNCTASVRLFISWLYRPQERTSMTLPSEFLWDTANYWSQQCLTAPSPRECSWTNRGKIIDAGRTTSWLTDWLSDI